MRLEMSLIKDTGLYNLESHSHSVSGPTNLSCLLVGKDSGLIPK